jgi:MFS family permease
MTGRELRASVSLASIFALRMLGLFMILPVFALHARGMPGGDDATMIGLAMGIYGLTQAVLHLPLGAASDRFGRKPVLVAGLVLFAAGSFAAAAATTVAGVVAGRALQGSGAISAAITAFIADSTRDSQRTKAMAMVGGSIALTFALSMVAAPALYEWIGMAGIFDLTGVLAIAAIGVVLFVVPAAPALPVPDERTRFAQVLLDPDLLRLNVGIFTLHAVQLSMFVVVPRWLVESAGLPLADHWKVYLSTVVLSFFAMLPPMIWGERRGRLRAVFVASIALLAMVCALFATHPSGLAPIGALLFGFFTAFNTLEAVLPSLVSRLGPPDAKGLALGVYNTTQALGLFAGGALGGLILSRAGEASVFVMCVALLLVWLAVAVGQRRWPARPAARD